MSRAVEVVDVSVCIVGAGAAGLTLAAALVQSGHEVCVLERGAADYRDPTMDDAVDVGRHGWPLDACRGQGLGGTLRHWRGICRVLAPHDFAAREAVAAGGWPFAYEAIEDHYRRAHELLGAARPFDDHDWADAWPAPPLDVTDAGLQNVAYALADPGRLARVLAPIVLGSPRARVLEGCTVEAVEDGHERSSVAARTRDGGRLRVRADVVVLAAGTLENTRLLLEHRIGNDWVGRCFMDHPHALLGVVRSAHVGRLAAYLDVGCGAGGVGRLLMQLDPQRLARSCCPGASVMLERTGRADVVALLARTEQVPSSDSCVRLGAPRASGGSRLEVDWRLGAVDRRAMEALLAACTDAMDGAGVGQVLPNVPESSDQWPAPMVGGCHHMGTTRMAVSPAGGAADGEGRLFGQERIYVAGGSVFPTCGVANPTSTIVALALRLAEHLTAHVLDRPAAHTRVVVADAWNGTEPARTSCGDADRTESFIRTIVADTAVRVDELLAWERVRVARLAVFDLDGTLVELHTAALVRELLGFVATMGYVDVSHQELLEHAGRDDLFGFLRPEDVGVIDRLFWDAFEPARLPAPSWIAGACDAVRRAQAAGLHRAVCTGRHASVDEIVRELDGLGGMALDRICSRGVGFTDKAQMLAWVCRELDVDPAHVVAVGDTPDDIVAARAVGVGCVVAVTTGACSPAVLAACGADLVLPSVSTLSRAWTRAGVAPAQAATA